MQKGFSTRETMENPFFFALEYQILVKELTMRELLQSINVAKMCNITNLNVNHIRNYISGKIAYLSPEEQPIIKEYCKKLLNTDWRN